MISPISYANSLWVWGLSACHLVAYNNALDSNSIVRGLKMRKMSKCFFFSIFHLLFSWIFSLPPSMLNPIQICFSLKNVVFSLLYSSPLWFSFKSLTLVYFKLTNRGCRIGATHCHVCLTSWFGLSCYTRKCRTSVTFYCSLG